MERFLSKICLYTNLLTGELEGGGFLANDFFFEKCQRRSVTVF